AFAFAPGTCTSAGGDVQQRGFTSTSAGKATFAFSSAGAYSSCTVNFSATNLTGVGATMTWTPAVADHLTCAFVPDTMASGTFPTVKGTVYVRDALGNGVPTGPHSCGL